MQGITISEITVLVVEPSSMQRRIIKCALNDADIVSILETSDGKSALEILHKESPDIVISALYLSDMAGTDLVHAIRESSTHHETAFMLITSETRFRYLDPIRQAGVVGILPKPFTTQELHTALSTALDLIDPDRLSLEDFDANNLKVLVVDDSALARKHISRVLEGMGIIAKNIDKANDGVEALDMVNQNYYDFVVSDYNMPNMDGKELIDHIRGESNQSSIPVLMVTSESDENRLAAVQQSGASAICDKPFEPNTVHRLISQFIST